MDGRDGLEEPGGLLDGHVQHVGDGLALVVHLQGVGVVPGAVADLARHVHVGQELHLDLDGAVARARLAPAALDVEREPARLVAADLGLGGLREQPADVIEHPGVGGRVGPRRAADRPLVDVHHLVQLLHPGDPGVLARHDPRAVQLLGQRAVQDVVDQGRLAGPGHAGDRDEAAERERHIHAAQIVLAGPLDHDLPGSWTASGARGQRDRLAAGQVGAGQRIPAGQQLVQRAGDHDVAAVLPRPRADVDHPVSRADGVLVVLHDDQRVAEVPEPDQGLQQPVVVALVQADRRLVEHVQHADQAGADLRGQPDPLRLAAGQGRRRPGPGSGSRAPRRAGSRAGS